MRASFLDFRKQAAVIRATLNRGEMVDLTYRGKVIAKIVPDVGEQSKRVKVADTEYFGMNRNDEMSTEEHMREIRKPRY